ncbi:MAG: ABC transporter permease subunit [Myxococcales bacterium]|nr:ABC transporter permease subunit [Myxococcales bacterium]
MTAPFGDVAARFRANRTAMFGLWLVGALVLFAVLGPIVISSDPNASEFSLPKSDSGGPPGPSLLHPLGTDPLYRDVLARLASGARTSLVIASVATGLALLLGTGLGVAAGWTAGTRARHVDLAVRAVLDVALAFPYLLLIVAIGVSLDRTDAFTVTLVLGLTSWVGIARLVREKTIAVRGADYITLARALGASEFRIIARHLLPAIAGTLLVVGSHAIAQMILAEAVLGYLTVGIAPPEPTWGRMLQEVEHYLSVAPLLVAAPALAILVAALGFTRVGDGLAAALAPRIARPDASIARQSRVPFDAALLACIVLVVVTRSADPLAAPIAAREVPNEPDGGVLRLATQAASVSLDPALAYDEASRAVNELVFARLVRFGPDGKLEGELAESFRSTDGGLRIEIALRPGLVFQDQSPLSAGDVKRSLERTLHPKTPCPGASLYGAIVGVDAFQSGSAQEITGIAVISERKLGFHLREPSSAFLALMTLGFASPVCSSMGAFADPMRPAVPCGAGPFRVATATHDRVSIERFDAAHLRPGLAGVTWELGVPPRSQLHRFQIGELDVISELSGVDTARFSADGRWHAHQAWLSRPASHGIFLNTGMEPFSNRHLRRAVAFAVDPSVVTRIRPNVSPIDRLIPSSVPRAELPQAVRRHDLAAALEEMKLAGYAYDPVRRIGGYPHAIDYFTTPASLDQAVAEVYQSQLARVGLRLRLRLLSHASFLAAVGTRANAAMGWRGWQADYPDASTFFEPTLTSAAIAEQGSQNVSFFAHPEFDRVIASARTELDLGVRNAIFARAEALVGQEAPWVPTYTVRSLVVWQPRVRGLVLDPFSSLRLESTTVAIESTAK